MLGVFSKFRGEPEVRPTWDIHGPLGEAGVAECGCMIKKNLKNCGFELWLGLPLCLALFTER